MVTFVAWSWPDLDLESIVSTINPFIGRLLATPISSRGRLGPPLRSRVLTGRFVKFKRHSIRLNMIYISKKKNFQKFIEGGIRGAKNMNFRYFFITYYRHVCEPILIQRVAIDRQWTGYSHIFVTLENSKIIGGYRSLNMWVQKCKMNRCLQLLSRSDGCEISLKSDSEMLLNGYNSICHP